MYSKLITKMNNHFSNLGSIIYSKSCDYFGINIITNDDINMYYNLLNSDEIIPEKISLNNHIACCLYYLTKEKEEYKEKFLDKFLRNITFDNLKIDEEHLILIFNIIEFDKTYLNSPKDHISFLYRLLKAFSNFSTNFENYILYKYFRGYLKYHLQDYVSANQEYIEIIAELPKNEELNYMLKYIKLINDLLKIKIFDNSKLSNKAEINEYWQFLKDLYNKVKVENIILALKLGFDLFSSYNKEKNYNDCIPLLLEMKKLLKKELLKGMIMENGINYYLAIASRLGYIGILLNNKKAINSAIKKIRKTLGMIKNDKNNENLLQLVKAYTFVLAILEIDLTKKTEYDIKSLAFDFKNNFLPDLDNNYPLNNFINEQNRDNIIIDFQIINDMNTEIITSGRNIFNKCISEINKKNYSNFLTFICAVHSKVNHYSESYISDKNETKRKSYKNRIIEYIDFSFNIIYKLLDDEPLLYTTYVKTIIIEIFSAYAHIFIYDKNFAQLRTAINTIDDLKNKLKFEDKIPSYALILKIKGDYWLYQKYYKDAIIYYENALNLFEENNTKIPQVLFNKGCALFFNGNKAEAIDHLNRCINEYNNLLMQKNIFGFTPDVNNINKKISAAKKLLNQISLK